tara:strand:+ start:1592 stop:2659 length:1068 start_codon:yes stop_codon:yes gene_type:complete
MARHKFIYSIFFAVFLSSLNLYSYANNKSTEDFKNTYQAKDKIDTDKSLTINTPYLLGAGDRLIVKVLGLEEKTYSILPDGYINFPEIGEMYVEGLTLKEFKHELKSKLKEYMISPDVYIGIIEYRPITVYVSGEVKRPGLYTIVSKKENQDSTIFPTLFDAIKTSSGITPFSDLSKVSVIRKNSKTNGGGKIKAEIDFLSLFTKGDQSNNVTISDGDTIIVPKSITSIKDQLVQASRSNLSPNTIVVYITGNVVSPGQQIVEQGSTLNQAIARSGGKKILSGKVKFIRLNNDGSAELRNISFNPNKKSSGSDNPILISGDIIHVNKSLIGVTTSVIREVTSPFTGAYGLYSLFN